MRSKTSRPSLRAYHCAPERKEIIEKTACVVFLVNRSFNKFLWRVWLESLIVRCSVRERLPNSLT